MNHHTSRTIGRTALSAFLATAMVALPAAADEKTPNQAPDTIHTPLGAILTPGQRLRVTAASTAFTGTTVGNLVKIGSDSVTLVDPGHGAVTELPFSAITRIEVGYGRRGTRKGLLIGLGVGAMFAVAISTDNSPSCGGYNEPLRPCTGGEKIGLSAFAAATSGGVGAWLGHRRKNDDWSDAPLEQLRVSVRPERRGASVGLTVSF